MNKHPLKDRYFKIHEVPGKIEYHLEPLNLISDFRAIVCTEGIECKSKYPVGPVSFCRSNGSCGMSWVVEAKVVIFKENAETAGKGTRIDLDPPFREPPNLPRA